METAKKRAIVVDKIQEIKSTNSFLKQICEQFPHFYTLRAVNQTAGRGRFSRQWISAPGDDLTFSTVIHVSDELQKWLVNIPQITALGIQELLLSMGVKSLIKWPNDILVETKKIAGILVEGVYKNNKQYLIVGVGLNVNSMPQEKVDIPATSILDQTGKKNDPDELLQKFVDIFSSKIETLSENGFAQFKNPLNLLLAFKNEIREVVIHDSVIRGELVGVGDDGGLLLKTEDGAVKSLISGEISFKK